MDIYKTPKAPVADKRPPAPPGSVAKALLVGTAIDIGGTFVAAFIIMLLALIVIRSQGQPISDINAALQLNDPESAFSWLLNGVGFLMSVNAGYWCARIANRPGYTVPVTQGLISLVSGVLLSPHNEVNASLLGLDVASFFAVLLGALLYQRSQRATPTGPA